MREQTVDIPAAAGVSLAGTVTGPDAGGRHPAALLINGSGPLDRDSATRGMALGLGPALAVALAGHGCVLLRYDKRGVGASGGDYLSAGFHDECADAAAALAAVRAHPAADPDRIFVIGHSTGAVVAATLVRATPPPAGYVLLAGAAQPGGSVLAWQSARIAATLPRPLRMAGPLLVRRQAREIARIRDSAADRPDRMPRSRLTDKWLREYLAHDPGADLAAVERPVLALTGGKDVQVDPADVARIGRLVAGPFDGEVPADLTHLLRRDAGPPGLWRYRAQLAGPVDGWVADRIAAWVRHRLVDAR